MVDTNVFVRFEKGAQAIDFSKYGQSELVYVSAITVSELIVGVHRANTEERKRRRSDFVEAVISAVEVLDFTLECARTHAALFADLAKKGQLIGAHDLIIAATARHHDMPILTDNLEEFSRIPGLRVIPFIR
jgi:tRNA(fMet)-specific endonuclease VapC